MSFKSEWNEIQKLKESVWKAKGMSFKSEWNEIQKRME
jgi:hypothetical protein